MDYTPDKLKMLTMGNIYVNESGLHIRLESEEVKGFCILRKIGEAIKRPVDAFGDAYDDHAYLWLNIPMTKIEKSHYFGNMSSERKKK